MYNKSIIIILVFFSSTKVFGQFYSFQPFEKHQNSKDEIHILSPITLNENISIYAINHTPLKKYADTALLAYTDSILDEIVFYNKLSKVRMSYPLRIINDTFNWCISAKPYYDSVSKITKFVVEQNLLADLQANIKKTENYLYSLDSNFKLISKIKLVDSSKKVFFYPDNIWINNANFYATTYNIFNAKLQYWIQKYDTHSGLLINEVICKGTDSAIHASFIKINLLNDSTIVGLSEGYYNYYTNIIDTNLNYKDTVRIPFDPINVYLEQKINTIPDLYFKDSVYYFLIGNNIDNVSPQYSRDESLQSIEIGTGKRKLIAKLKYQSIANYNNRKNYTPQISTSFCNKNKIYNVIIKPWDNENNNDTSYLFKNYVCLSSSNIDSTLNWQKYIGGDMDYSDAKVFSTQDSGCVVYALGFDNSDSTIIGSNSWRADLAWNTYYIKFDKYGNQQLDWAETPTPIKNLAVQTTDVKIYPNPFNTLLHIDFEKTTNAVCSFIDINGNTVVQKTLNNCNNTIDINNLPSGIYILKIVNENRCTFKKVVKIN